MDDQSRNLILATALSFLVLLGWFVLGPILFPDAFPPPPRRPRRPPETAQDATTAARPAPPAHAGARAAAAASRRPARRCWRQSARLPIRTARVSGSLSLVGGRIDDL